MPGLSLWFACLPVLLVACAPAYYVVRSTPLVEAPAQESPAPGTTPRISDLKRVSLVPWDACASGTAAEKDECAAGLGALELALVAHGFEVVSWQALRDQTTRHNQTAGEAAQALGVPHLVRVHAPEVESSTPHLRFQRSYHASDASGSLGAALDLPARDADRLDVIAGRAEQEAPFARSSLVSVQVSVERAGGELLAMERATTSEPAPRPHALALLVRCQQGTCTALVRGDEPSRRPARAKSERVLLPPPAAAPPLERVAGQLAARLATLAGLARD